MVTLAKDEILKKVSQARLAKLKLDIQVKRLGLREIERGYQLKVEKAIRVWQKQWNGIAASVGRKLYPMAQREIAKKNIADSGLDEVWSPRLYLTKSVYDIPPRYRKPVNAAINIVPNKTGLISATFLHLQDVYNRTGQGMASGLGMDVAFRLRDRDILKALDERANFLAGSVSDTTFNRLKYQVATSYMEGKHPTLRTVHPVTGARLSSVAEDISGFFDGQMARSRTVARTETMVAQSTAEMDFNKRVGIKKHGWMTARDATVRDSHRKNEGAEVPIGNRFPNGQLRVGEGSAEDVINCRCSNYPVVDTGVKLNAWDGSAGPAAPVEFATTDEWLKNLPKEEKKVILNYTGVAYRDINPLQRGIAEGRISAAMIKKDSRLKSVYTEIQTMEKAFATAPKYTDPDLYRGVKFVKPDVAGYNKFVSNLKVGNEFTSISFMSTSKSRKVAEGFLYRETHNVLFKIKSTVGRKGVDITALGRVSEFEVLFLRGARFKIDSVKDITIAGVKVKEVIIHEI